MSFYDLPAWKTGTFVGFKHKYLSIKPSDPSKPVLLLLHGFPDGPLSFSTVIPYFVRAGFGVIAPELLGYGDTEKPEAIEAYSNKIISNVLVGILNHEGITEPVIVLGHDSGSVVATRFTQFNPTLVKGLILAGFSYIPPSSQPFDPDAINAFVSPHSGYENFGYIKFISRPDAAEVIEDHFASFLSLLFAEPQVWKERFCPTGALEATLKKDHISTLASWVTDDWRRDIGAFLLHTGLQGPTMSHQPRLKVSILKERKTLIPRSNIPRCFWKQPRTPSHQDGLHMRDRQH
jgi:pimeloyl-ACP methyl ester carboxylesterase